LLLAVSRKITVPVGAAGLKLVTVDVKVNWDADCTALMAVEVAKPLPIATLCDEDELVAYNLVPANFARTLCTPGGSMRLSDADPSAFNCAWPRMLRSSQNAASALQNETRPGETAIPADETVALRFSRVPAATFPSGETARAVVVGEGVAARIRTDASRQSANRRYSLRVRVEKESPGIIDLPGSEGMTTLKPFASTREECKSSRSTAAFILAWARVSLFQLVVQNGGDILHGR
jgi:hypothetical protein